MQLNERLQQLREKAGFENAKLFAKAIKMPYSTYSTYESGKSEPKATALVKIAAALHVSVDDLLGYHVDDFDTAAALFREATGKTATRNGDKVQIENDPVWKRPISENAFLAVMRDANENFEKLRPTYLKPFIRDGLDLSYRIEYKESPFKGTPLEKAEEYLRPKDLHGFMDKLTLAKTRTERANVIKDIAVEIQINKKFRKLIEESTPPAQDHDDTDDEKATEKGPHSNE